MKCKYTGLGDFADWNPCWDSDKLVLAFSFTTLAFRLPRFWAELVGPPEERPRRQLAVAKDADFARDGLGGGSGIPGNHDDPNTSRGAGLDGRLDLGPRGIFNTAHTFKNQILFDAFEVGRVLQFFGSAALVRFQIFVSGKVFADRHG